MPTLHGLYYSGVIGLYVLCVSGRVWGEVRDPGLHVTYEHGEVPTKEHIEAARSVMIIPKGETEEELQDATDEDVLRWSKAKQLASITVSGEGITDKGVVAICQLSTLESVSLHNCSVTDRAVAALSGLKELRKLDLSGTKVSVDGIRLLKKCRKLEALNLARTNVDDGVWRVLGTLTVKDVDLSYTRVTDEGLRELESCQQLRVVDVSGTGLTDSALKAFTKLRWLEQLAIPRVGNNAVRELRKAMPKTSIYSY